MNAPRESRRFRARNQSETWRTNGQGRCWVQGGEELRVIRVRTSKRWSGYGKVEDARGPR